MDLFPNTPHFELVFLLLRGKALERYLEENPQIPEKSVEKAMESESVEKMEVKMDPSGNSEVNSSEPVEKATEGENSDKTEGAVKEETKSDMES